MIDNRYIDRQKHQGIENGMEEKGEREGRKEIGDMMQIKEERKQ